MCRWWWKYNKISETLNSYLVWYLVSVLPSTELDFKSRKWSFSYAPKLPLNHADSRSWQCHLLKILVWSLFSSTRSHLREREMMFLAVIYPNSAGLLVPYAWSYYAEEGNVSEYIINFLIHFLSDSITGRNWGIPFLQRAWDSLMPGWRKCKSTVFIPLFFWVIIVCTSEVSCHNCSWHLVNNWNQIFPCISLLNQG